jgi:hypothetical protein
VRLAGPAVLVRVPFQTAHRRFTQGTKAGLWPRLHRAVLDEPGSRGLTGWSRAIADAACVRAKKGGTMTGPSPVDRDKPGPGDPRAAGRGGIPLSWRRPRRTPTTPSHCSPWSGPSPPSGPPRPAPPQAGQAARAHYAYDQADLRTWLRERGIAVRIARKGCKVSPTQGWEQSHIQFDDGRNNGLVRSQSGPLARSPGT